MLRIYHGDEIAYVANDLRIILRQCLKSWQTVLADKGCRCSLDLSASMPVLCQAEDTRPLIQGLFELTVGRLGTGGELSIVGCRGANAVEVEFADTGSVLQSESPADRVLFPPRAIVRDRHLTILQTLALSFGGRIWATPCPQGGMAWTLRLPARAALKRMA